MCNYNKRWFALVLFSIRGLELFKWFSFIYILYTLICKFIYSFLIRLVLFSNNQHLQSICSSHFLLMSKLIWHLTIEAFRVFVVLSHIFSIFSHVNSILVYCLKFLILAQVACLFFFIFESNSISSLWLTYSIVLVNWYPFSRQKRERDSVGTDECLIIIN